MKPRFPYAQTREEAAVFNDAPQNVRAMAKEILKQGYNPLNTARALLVLPKSSFGVKGYDAYTLWLSKNYFLRKRHRPNPGKPHWPRELRFTDWPSARSRYRLLYEELSGEWKVYRAFESREALNAWAEENGFEAYRQ